MLNALSRFFAQVAHRLAIGNHLRTQQYSKRRLFVVAYFLFWFVYFSYFWWNALVLDASSNLIANNVNMWGDWAAHFTMISAFAYRSLIPSEGPFLLGSQFSYPFVSNWLAGVGVRLGTSLFWTPVVLSYIFSLATVGALFAFFKLFSRSSMVAITASLIFLLNGGLGFTYFFQDLVASAQPLSVLANPPREYTNIEPELIRWISVINSMIIPQRAFILGFPLTVSLLALVYYWWFRAKKLPASWKIVLLGTGFGLLPIIHAHSFLAAGVILTCWMGADLLTAGKKLRTERLCSWLVLGGVSAGLGAFLSMLFLQGNLESDFFRWLPGWYAAEFEIGWLEFWVLNWGITPLLALTGLLVVVLRARELPNFRTQVLRQLLLFAPFVILFVLLNLFLFQPFIWDNTKLLVWVSLGFSLLAAYTLQHIWQTKPRYLFRWGAAVLGIVMVLSGSIDAWRVVRPHLHNYQMYSAQELELAEWARTTDPTAVWLTGDQHNHWVFSLAGRKTILTYRGWLWTHGYDYSQEERDVLSLFSQPNQPALLEKYNLQYAVIGPNELDVWRANKEQFDTQFPVLKKTQYYTVYGLN